MSSSQQLRQVIFAQVRVNTNLLSSSLYSRGSQQLLCSRRLPFFLRVLVRSVSFQDFPVFSRIWTRVAKSISSSYDSYAMSTSYIHSSVWFKIDLSIRFHLIRSNGITSLIYLVQTLPSATDKPVLITSFNDCNYSSNRLLTSTASNSPEIIT